MSWTRSTAILARRAKIVLLATTALFATLKVTTGHVTGAVKSKRRRQESLGFLRQLDRDHPERELHLVMDNYATHKTGLLHI